MSLFNFVDRHSFFALMFPSDESRPILDISGVAGVLGGDKAVSAMATAYIFENRLWLGWYNSPGSYLVAKRFTLLAKSRFLDGIVPRVQVDPGILFDSQWKGPRFRATRTGTIIEETGPLAALFMKECTGLEGEVLEGRMAQPIGVTIADLRHEPVPHTCNKPINAYTPVFACVPTSVSIGACVACGVFEDWYALSLILVGIIANGVSCATIGSGNLVFSYPVPNGSLAGGGILSSDKEIVLLLGSEIAVSSITRGKFSLGFSSEPAYRCIGWCSVLLTVQFFVQLLLIRQASSFGQLMFVISLAVSSVYNSWMSSLDKEKIEREILINNVLEKPVLKKYTLGTRTAMAVFVLLVLQPEDPRKILNELFRYNDKVWKQWKEAIAQRIINKEKLEFVDTDWELDELNLDETILLQMLYGDAQIAYGGYLRYSASK